MSTAGKIRKDLLKDITVIFGSVKCTVLSSTFFFNFRGFMEAHLMHKAKNGINIPVINRHRMKMELVLLAEYLYGPFPKNEHQSVIGGE